MPFFGLSQSMAARVLHIATAANRIAIRLPTTTVSSEAGCGRAAWQLLPKMLLGHDRPSRAVETQNSLSRRHL